ncbi:methyl-accepting chemotaxis protein [Chondrocystis sp. NIES-4102]|nr:methyl-accepting chemotaxis protein [Chondrocystis sp. NIES-4102]
MTKQNSQPQPSTIDQPEAIYPPPQQFYNISKFGLKTKIILAAIALSAIPVAILGTISYQVTKAYLTRQITQVQFARTHHLAKMVKQFLQTRVSEGEAFASNPIFTNPNVINTVSVGEKNLALKDFKQQTNYYERIVYLDLAGQPLYQSQSSSALFSDYNRLSYFRTAIATKKTVMGEVAESNLTTKSHIEFAVPVINNWTNEVLGIMLFTIAGEQITPLFQNYLTQDEQWQMIATASVFLDSGVENLSDQPLIKYDPQLQKAHQTRQVTTVLLDSPYKANFQQLVNYAPVEVDSLNPQLNLGTAIALDTNIAFAPLKPLRWTFLGGTILTTLIVAAISGFLANRLIQPLLKLTSAVNKLSQGKFDTRIQLQGKDELTVLGNQINDMAQQLNIAMQRQKTIAKTSEMMARMSQARSARDLQMPLSLFLAQIRNLIKADRLIFYQFNSQWGGTVIAESVALEFPRCLGVQFDDPCFAQDYVRKYQRGRILAVSDILQANFTQCHLDQLAPYNVKASLILPVIFESTNPDDPEKLIGLLIAHQCSNTRVWTQLDIDYLQQIAYQLAMVLRGYIYYQEDSLYKANLEQDLIQVISNFQAIVNGNLISRNLKRNTDKSEVMAAFEAAKHSLRQTLAKIKYPTQQINFQLGANNQDFARLQEQFKQQNKQLLLVFSLMEKTINSIQQAGIKINATSANIDSLVTAIVDEKNNYHQAIDLVNHLKTTLRTNTDKVKDIQRVSQKMNRITSSMKKINLRASLLVNKLSERILQMNDSADDLKGEIESLQQAIKTTQELENVATDLEREIAQVLREYEISETKLAQDEDIISDAGNSFEQIVATIQAVEQDILEIANQTKLQINNNKKIINFQKKINQTSNAIETLGDRSLVSLKKSSITAQDLANVVNFFKLDDSDMK